VRTHGRLFKAQFSQKVHAGPPSVGRSPMSVFLFFILFSPPAVLTAKTRGGDSRLYRGVGGKRGWAARSPGREPSMPAGSEAFLRVESSLVLRVHF